MSSALNLPKHETAVFASTANSAASNVLIAANAHAVFERSCALNLPRRCVASFGKTKKVP